jgi:hypothetical protein
MEKVINKYRFMQYFNKQDGSSNDDDNEPSNDGLLNGSEISTKGQDTEEQ